VAYVAALLGYGPDDSSAAQKQKIRKTVARFGGMLAEGLIFTDWNPVFMPWLPPRRNRYYELA
jgi:hypothetical protein